MLELILGPAGSGKTQRVFSAVRSRGADGQRSILIMPEQFSHDAERQLCAACGDGVSLYGEVLSFTRLASRTRCPACGRMLDKGGRLLLMERALSEVMTRLKVFSSGRRTDLPGELVCTYDQLRAACVDPGEAAAALRDMPGRLADKLDDLALIFEAYRALMPDGVYDPADRLDQLAEAVAGGGLPEGAAVYIDGFTDFTAQETAVIRAMLARQTDVTVCLTCGGPDGSEEVFALPRATSAQLARLARERGCACSVVRCSAQAERSPVLAAACDGLFDPAAQPACGAQDAIALLSAPSLTAECETAAACVRALARQYGYRWREFAVVARGWEDYRSAAENIFEKYEIPVTRTAKTDITENPILAFVLAALDAVAGNWECTPVFRMLKTGLTDISAQRRDLLENYVLKWNLRGSAAWLKSGGWNMNPAGYAPRMSAADAAVLEEVNAARAETAALLEPLESGLKKAQGAAGKTAALYAFIEAAVLPERIVDKARRLRLCGDGQLADEYDQIWEILVSALEQFAAVLGDMPLSDEEFARLLRLLLSQYDVGAIPASVDSVGMGDMSRMRRRGIRCLIVLGADDSHLPAVPAGGGLLTDTDCADLAACGFALADTAEARLDREMHLIYTSLSLPSERLIVIRTDDAGGKRQSLITARLSVLFGIQEKAAGLMRLAEAPMPCFELAAMDSADAEPAARAAAECLMTMDDWREKLTAARQAAEIGRGSLSAQVAGALYPEKMRLSATCVDRYEACKFAYFLRYALKAEPRRPAGFDAPESGTYIHFLMENIAREAQEHGGFSKLSAEECRALTRRYSEVYAAQYIGPLEQKSQRFVYLFRRLTEDAAHIVQDMAEELAVSDFQPLDFELSFRPGGDLPPVDIGGGTAVGGKVDRVDGWLRDGRLYLRVVDYKTGRKDFSLSDIWYGMGMQMLMYLFALEASGAERYGHEIVPAGVLYAPARDVIVLAGRGADREQIRALRSRELVRKGLILADPAVIDAMEHAEEHRFLPVRFTKDGVPSPENLATLEQLGLLRSHIERTLRTMRREIRAGRITADPYYRSVQDNACLYCEYSEACHFDEENGGDRRRFLTKLKTPEVWSRMEGENAHG